MRNRKLIIGLLFVFNSILVFGQCEYTLDNYSHNNCYGANNGSIDITIANLNSLPSWIGPNGFTSSSNALTNLYAGTYYLTITNTVQACTLIDSIDIQETIKVGANFNLTGRCQDEDSVDVVATLWGGTPPYTSIWSNGDTGPNAINLPPTGSLPNVLTVTDANFCVDTLHLWVKELNAMNPFMSSVGVVCKDDNSGEARVFIEGGTSPFIFNWGDEITPMVHESFSVIAGLSPEVYYVEITDDMGCVIKDSIEVKSNPNICLTIYKAFSPNDDDIHEFWEIENIHLYPKAVVSVYDRNGRQVFRRRNYTNSENAAFGGKDTNDQPLPSGTYYYVIDLENGDDVFKGTITIVR
ncbi:MAG: gliding motility-associated C-terminal domain-containing protein [Bacteroidota bacterium]|nr:gliding motility-associated C-terminal domain-containing protein [Bacteroidota bacterium]